MTTTPTSKIEARPISRELWSAARIYLGNWRVLMILAAVAIVGGAALNWSWLVAIGVAPLLLTTLPCLVMCGLGLCMHKMGGGSGASQPAPSQSTEIAAQSSASIAAPAKSRSLLAGVSSCCGAAAATQPATDPQQVQLSNERKNPHA